MLPMMRTMLKTSRMEEYEYLIIRQTAVAFVEDAFMIGLKVDDSCGQLMAFLQLCSL